MYALTLDRLRHVVVVAPHADDETIAAFHTISALRRRGARVDVVVVTDGAASHRASPSFPAPRLVALRRAETLGAMRLLGVPRHRVAFLDLPDGGLRDLGPAQVRAVLRRLRARPRPDAVIVPSASDAHPDHRVVARLCDLAWPARVARLRYLVWPAPLQRARGGGRMVGRHGDAGMKRAALHRYRTQTGMIEDDPDGFRLTTAMIRRMCAPAERFAC